MAAVSKDTFFNGRLHITQPLNGYRYSIDAVLLAAAIKPQMGETVLDLGTGCGIIPLILAARHPGIHIAGVEIQEELALLAQRNIVDNGYEATVTVRHGDLKMLPDHKTTGPFDWVVSNPPYRRPGTGRINPNQQKALARFEIKVDLVQLLQSAEKLLRTGGRFATIYTAERMVDLIVQMRQADIEPQSIQAVQSYRGEAAKLVLVKGTKGGRIGLCINAPLVVYELDGSYTEAIEIMMQP